VISDNCRHSFQLKYAARALGDLGPDSRSIAFLQDCDPSYNIWVKVAKAKLGLLPSEEVFNLMSYRGRDESEVIREAGRAMYMLVQNKDEKE
jgi:hypothetical protein